MLNKSVIAVSVIATLAGCSMMNSSNQSVVNSLADNLDIHYTVLTNHGADKGANVLC